MNFGSYKIKTPRFEKFLNLVMFCNFLMMIVCSGALTAANLAWNKNYYDKYLYIF